MVGYTMTIGEIVIGGRPVSTGQTAVLIEIVTVDCAFVTRRKNSAVDSRAIRHDCLMADYSEVAG